MLHEVPVIASLVCWPGVCRAETVGGEGYTVGGNEMITGAFRSLAAAADCPAT